MTRLEAIDRAERIWGEGRVHVTPAVGSTRQPGTTEWWVDVGRRSHSLDCNGYATCHEDCAEVEVQVCP